MASNMIRTCATRALVSLQLKNKNNNSFKYFHSFSIKTFNLLKLFNRANSLYKPLMSLPIAANKVILENRFFFSLVYLK
jgi:hypothetical protein